MSLLRVEQVTAGFPPVATQSLLQPSFHKLRGVANCARGGVTLRMITGDITAALGQALSQRIGEERYSLWFQSKTKVTVDQGALRIGVPNHFYQEWLEKTFGADLQVIADQLLGQRAPISFALDPELFRAARQREAQAELPVLQEAPFRAATVRERGEASTAPDPKRGREENRRDAGSTVAPAANASPRAKNRSRRFRRLDDFVIGPCNRVAHESRRYRDQSTQCHR